MQGAITSVGVPIGVAILLFFITPWLQDRITEPTCDAPRSLRLVHPTLATSSEPVYRDAASGVAYDGQLAIDGDTSTAWVEGVIDSENRYGTGASITLTLPEGTDVQMLCLVNGYAKSDETFVQNARVRQWKVDTQAGARASVLPDKSVANLTEYQSLELVKGSTSSVTLTMETFRAPTGAIRYTDTALSEIEVWAQ